MAEADSTTPVSSKLDAIDALDEAAAIARFLQAFSLTPGAGGEVHLTAGQLSGFYYVMQSLIDRISSAKSSVKEVLHG